MPQNAPPRQAVLFDLDGTLADSVALILSAFRHTFAVHTGTIPPDAAWIAGMGTPLASQIRALVADAALHEPMLHTYRAFQLEHHDRLLREYDGVRETLALLHARGHPMAIVTSKASDSAHRALTRLGLDDYIDVVVGLDSCARHKPDPEPVRTALALLGVRPGHAVFVGDSPYDMMAGNAAGVTTIAALWGPFSRDELERVHPRRFLAQIGDLPPLLAELARPGD